MMQVQPVSFAAPRAAAEKWAVSTSSAQSAVLGAGDHVFVCDQDCNILFGTNPTATASSQFVPAKTLIRLRGVLSGEKCAVIAAGAGSAWIARG